MIVIVTVLDQFYYLRIYRCTWEIRCHATREIRMPTLLRDFLTKFLERVIKNWIRTLQWADTPFFANSKNTPLVDFGQINWRSFLLLLIWHLVSHLWWGRRDLKYRNIFMDLIHSNPVNPLFSGRVFENTSYIKSPGLTSDSDNWAPELQ